MNIHNQFRDRVVAALERIGAGVDHHGDGLARVVVETPRERSHGDLTTNAAMVMAKPLGMAPRALAEKLAAVLGDDDDIAALEVAGPGFINMTLADAVWSGCIVAALDQAEAFGRSQLGAGRKVNVEYVSANPTGPLHVGHCRGAVFGDALARLLEETGHTVTREYYINDAGAQIDVLARSAYLRYLEALGEDIGEIPAGLYPGDYLKPVGEALKAEFGDGLKAMDEDRRLEVTRRQATAMMLDQIRADLAALNINQEVFFSEQSLHDSGAIADTVEDLRRRGLVYEGRLPPPKGKPAEDWEDREQLLFRSSDFGDDSDRPLRKSDGTYTYFAADVAYARDKVGRGFDELVYVLGADHSGYVKRLQAVTRAVSAGKVEAVVRLCQLVRLFRGGEPVKMSKRAGEFITLRDVVDEVGADVTRFIMLTRKNDAPLDFDFARAVEQSRDNPVFYVQYAHARICSVMDNAREQAPEAVKMAANVKVAWLNRLDDCAERALIRRVCEYPRVLEQAAKHHEPHRVSFYLYDLAAEFHALWNRGKESPQLRFILLNEVQTTAARLALLRVIRYALGNGLRVLGVTPVDQM